jgi:ubiquitin-like 1-activating enzyme E1 A
MASSASTVTTGSGASTTKKAPTNSDVYDRQIRLWGAEAQKKMQNSKVLYIHITGTTSEVLKNLVLAGISATLCDTRPAVALDSSPCFFSPIETTSGDSDKLNENPAQKKIKYVSVAEAVQPQVESLNPLLGACPLLVKDVSKLAEEDLKDFTVVVASQIPLEEAVRLSTIVTAQGHAFFVADCFGMWGAAMIDLGENFQYRPEQGKKLLDPTGLADYAPISEMVHVPLHTAINRFHKQPPPTWVMYRCLLEYQQQTKQWLGDDNVDIEEAKTIIQNFLTQEQAELTEDDLVSLVTVGMAQVIPICAVLGGIIGNEAIKIISGKGEPANNTLLLDGNSCKTWTFLVKAKK